MTNFPKRLIEVDLPIARISAHARREKSIRHGHISTLHIWWARRPLAACRAVICAALWPDPADPHCPMSFREAAVRLMTAFAQRFFPERINEEKRQLHATASPENLARWEALAAHTLTLDAAEPADLGIIRFCLLDFIADFANWDNSTVPAYLETSRALTQAAHEALGGEPGTRPLVVDPFAGGGSIPLEALRVGADAFASDLNPVAVLLNKVMLEYIPKYGEKLADEVRKWGAWIKEMAEKELAEFYPQDDDGATPIAYLWARTIRCEGAGCGAEVPLLRSPWLAKKANKSVVLKIVRNPKAKRVDFEIINDATLKDVGEGIVKRGSATCPCCGYTTPVKSVREQLKKRRGGSADARLYCVVTTRPKVQGRFYRLPNKHDLETVAKATVALEKRKRESVGMLTLVPNEPTPEGKGSGAGRAFSQRSYGIATFDDLYTARQALTLSTIATIISDRTMSDLPPIGRILCGFALGRLNDLSMSLCRWLNTLEAIAAANGGQNRMPVNLDFVEANPFGGSGGAWEGQIDWIARVVDHILESRLTTGSAGRSPAQTPLLPHASADFLFTDPPYYDAFPYSDLSDFFFVWLKRAIGNDLMNYDGNLVPKEKEAVVYDVPHGSDEIKDRAFFQREMTRSFSAWRDVILESGICVVVFANKTTEGWEALVQSVHEAGWTATGSWPIDTERPNRQRALDSAALASSVHLVCRPRTNKDVGDWRDVLAELPKRMHEWMPRLTAEGVVGADAIFACLGPALEIFSRYARVEKLNGDPVLLKEYLEHVWAAVSKEALSTIFRDADASGLEPDARLTAMWLWTVGGGAPAANGKRSVDKEADDEEPDEESEASGKTAASIGFTLEFDAARKIAQGLGIHLEKSESIVEVSGEKARLLAVGERTKHLFGKDTEVGPTAGKKSKKPKQGSLFEELESAEEASGGWEELRGPPPGTTALDRLHQAMILFGAQRGELLKRFLVEDGVGKDARFWKLAQSLAALYPPGTDERRWVEGVLARKKGLGL